MALLQSALIIFLAALATAQTQQHEKPWRPLFNGENLSGWKQVGPGSFQVTGHMLKSQGGMGMMWYTLEKFDDITIRVVFRLTGKTSDSGVFIRIPGTPRDVWAPINKAYEIEIGDWPDDYSCTGVVYSFSKALARPINPIGEWNTMDIISDGPKIIVYLNNVKVTDYREGQPVPARTFAPGEPAAGPRPDSGYIGLQNHPGPEVYFKEVSVGSLK